MPTHPMYKAEGSYSELQLSQGDILNREKMKEALAGHQDYFANAKHFRGFCVVTQSCDLVRGQLAEFIYLAVIRDVLEAFDQRDFTNGGAQSSTRDVLTKMVTHSYNKRGFFYLPKRVKSGVTTDSVVDLRVIFCIHSRTHYEQLLQARTGVLREDYAGQLGSLAAQTFSRVALPSWEDVWDDISIKDKVKELFDLIKQKHGAPAP